MCCLNNYEKTMYKVCHFLNMEMPELVTRSTLKKRQTKNKRDIIDNYAEIHSILEKANMTKRQFQDVREELHQHMKSDSNVFVRYRSAFTLAAHDPGVYRDEVIDVLTEAEKDPDVSDIAKKYKSRI